MIRRIKWNGRAAELFAMAAIPLTVLFVFSYLPMFGIVIAFKDFQYDGIWQSPWVGFDNFKFLFTSQDAWRITRNTITLNFTFILTTQVVGLFFAIVLNNVKSKFALRFYQTAMFMPYILSSSVVAYIAHSFLDVNYGFINHFIQALGGEAVMWYSEPKFWPFILTLVNLWKHVGYNVIIYYAALIGIDACLYESATIDGANKLKSVWYITLPMLIPIAIMLFLLNIGRIFYADFGLFYMIPKDSGMLYPTTDVIDTYVYRALRSRGDIGIASATGFYQAIVGFVLVVSANWLAKRFDKDYGLF